MADMKNIIMENYINWIKDNTFMKDIKGNIIKITSPFLDARNDYIQIYAKKIKEDIYCLTDGGYFVIDLSSYGIELTPKREELFENTLNAYGIKYNTKNNLNEVYIDTDLQNIGKSKHRLIQCLITLNDFFNYTQQNVKELFFYDVYDKFKKSEVIFSPNVSISGNSGYYHKFDFTIGVKKDRPETLIRLIATPSNKQSAEAYIFSFIDIRKSNRRFKAMIIYRGGEKVSEAFLQACKQYEVETYSWDKKEEIVEILR